ISVMARVLSQGTTITVDCDGVAESIGCITSFTTPSPTRDPIDLTCLTSTSKETALDIPDNGTATLDIIFDDCDDGQEALLDQIGGEDSCEFVITLSGGSTITFDARVQSFELTGS